MSTKARTIVLVLLGSFGVAAAAPGTPARAASAGGSENAVVPNVMMVPVAAGMVILNVDRGTVSFCSHIATASIPPTPIGKCASIGSVGTTTITFGYTLTVAGSTAFVYNRSTGRIHQCTTATNATGAAQGTCKEIGNSNVM